MAHLGALFVWFEICLANRLDWLGRKISRFGKYVSSKAQKWADAALKRYGHFYGRGR